MPPMTSYRFGDIVLVPFPFSNLTESKQRPAVIVSSAAYQQARPDCILLAITSQIRAPLGYGEALIDGWKVAGLLKSSLFKPLIFTVEQSLIRRRLGALIQSDQETLGGILRLIMPQGLSA